MSGLDIELRFPLREQIRIITVSPPEPLRVGLGRPTSPYRGGFDASHLCAAPKFPLKGGCPEGRGCLRAMDYRAWHGTAISTVSPALLGTKASLV